MPLPPFSVLVAMSDEEKDALFDSEVELMMLDIDPDKRHRFRAMANGCKLRNQAAKSRNQSMINAQADMWKAFHKLNSQLQELTSLTKET